MIRRTRSKLASSNAPGRPFQAGNKAAARRMRERLALDDSLRSAATADDVRAIVERLVKQARNGSIKAAALLLSYLLGKPRLQAAPALEGFALPSCRTAEECSEAMGKILAAVGQGQITLDQASRLADLVSAARHVIEVCDQENRIRALEEMRS